MRSSLRSISPSASPPPASVFSSSFRLLSSEDRRHTLPSRHRRCASQMRDNDSNVFIEAAIYLPKQILLVQFVMHTL